MSERLSDVLASQGEAPEVPPSAMRLGDFTSLPREQSVPFSDDILEISEEQKSAWKARGPIGFMEAFRRENKAEILPFNLGSLISKEPVGLFKSFSLMRAVNRLHDPTTSQDQRAKDESLVGDYLVQLEEERIRTFSTRGKIAKGIVNLPPYMIEFLATGGAASLGKAAIRKSISGVARKIVESGTLKATTRVAGGVAGAVARTAAMPHRLAQGFAERQLAAGLELTDEGIKLADEVSEQPHVSALKAFGDVMIENFSEVTGPAIGRTAGYLIPQQLKQGLEKLFVKLHPSESVRKLWTKAGYHGFLEELGEERVGDFLRAVTGVEDFGAKDPDSIFDRVVSSIPNAEELLVEAAVLSIPGAARMTTSQIINLIQTRKKEDGAIEPELQNIPDERIYEILQGPKKEEVRAPAEPLDILGQAEESLEAAAEVLPIELKDQIEAVGVNPSLVEDAIRTFREAEATGEGPGTIQAALQNLGIELPPEVSESLQKVLLEPAEAVKAQIPAQVVPWEAIPSKSLGALIVDAPFEERTAFSQKAIQLIRGSAGQDLLAEELGIAQAKTDPSTGAYAGGINPNAVTILSADTPIEKVRAYARAIQYIYKQDAVPFFKASEKGPTPGVVFRFGESLTPEMEEKFFSVLRGALTESAGYTKLNDKEITVLDFEGLPKFLERIRTLDEENGESIGIESWRDFSAESEYGPTHDWKSDPKGESLRGAASEGSPSLQAGLDSRRKAFERLLSESSATINAETALRSGLILQYTPYPGLTPEQREVETRLADSLSRPNAIEKYEFMPATLDGKMLNADLVRFVSKEFAANKESATLHTLSTQKPSTAWIKKHYLEKLAQPGSGRVLFFAGGGGSGKTTTATGPLASIADESDIIFDGVMSDAIKSAEQIDAALASGRPVTIAYVHRPLKNAAEAVRERYLLTGRYVPSEVLTEDHVRSQQTILQLADQYKDNPAVDIRIYDTSSGTPKTSSLDTIRNLSYTKGGESVEETVARLLPKVREVLQDVEEEAERIIARGTEEKEFGLREAAGRGGVSLVAEGIPGRPEGVALKSSPLKRTIRELTGQYHKELPTIKAYQALKESLRVQAKAAREAARMTREEIKAAQTQLVELLEKSGLAPEDKAKFIRTIKNIQSQEQLSGSLPEIEARVDALIEASAKRKTISAIHEELRAVTPKRQAGRLVGRFTPEIQAALDRMRRAERLTQAAAAAKLEENLSKNNSGNTFIPDPLTALENKMLNLVASREALSSKELGEMLFLIRTLKLAGKEARLVKELRDQADLTQKQQIALSIIDSRPKDKIPTTADESADDTKWGWYNRATSWLLGWNNILNRLSRNDKFTTTNRSLLNQHASVSEEEIVEKRGIRLNLKKLRKMWVQHFGEMNDWELTKRWAEDSKQRSLGQFTNVRGEKIELVISRAEARKRWMEFQDPTLNETIFGEQGMAWSQDMRKAVENLLSPQDIAFARDQMSFYQNYYNDFNKVFSSINGVNLPQNKAYSPIRRVVLEREVLENELLGEMTHRRAITPSAGKFRVKNIRALQQLNDIDIIQRHIQQVEHYKAWAEKIRVLNGIFNDPKVREAIQTNFGKGLLAAVDRNIEDFTRGGIDRSSDSAVLNVIKNNYTVSVLAAKGAIAIKQFMAFPAFADAIPTKDFITGLLDFGIDSRKKMMILASSEVMRSRGLAITPEMKEAIESSEWASFQMNPNLRNMLLTMTRFGDRASIFLGGWPVYRYHREVLGKPHSEAIKAFEIALSDSQQSADLSQASMFQRGNSWQRLFSVFLSAPNQYFRKELMATEDMLAGRLSKQQWAKTIAIYHFILPMMFQWAADGLEYRVKDQIRAGLLGSFNGVFILGEVLNAMLGQVLGLKVWQSKTIIDSISREAMDFIKKLNPEDLDAESFFDAIKQGLTLSGLVKGLPMDQAINITEGMKQMGEADTTEEFWKGFRRVAGWSKYVVDEGGKNKGPF